jgi:hypothetical protein
MAQADALCALQAKSEQSLDEAALRQLWELLQENASAAAVDGADGAAASGQYQGAQLRINYDQFCQVQRHSQCIVALQQ